MMRRTVIGALGLVILLLAVATLWYRHEYGTWWTTPDKIPYCQRTYLRGTSDLSRVQVQALEAHTNLTGEQPYPLVAVGHAPPIIGSELFAAVIPDAIRNRLHLPCAMAVYLKTGNNQYTAYGLSGGP